MIFFYLFISWCITSAIVNGSLLNPIRNYLIVQAPFISNLLVCVRCLGFWVGLGIYFLLNEYNISNITIVGIPLYVHYIIYPFIQSTFGVFLESIVRFLNK
jgi:hypothetical protein